MDKIHAQVEAILSPVYLVGGSVRDELMGVEPKDYDFITPHKPDMIEHKIREVKRRPFLTGKRFGTIGVKLGGHMIEITTFRTERYRTGNRKPEVEFVSDIADDLSRRDFTINAIAKRGNELIDPFNGRGDITDRVIRCVGAAVLRFGEDPLRMLRAARFSAQLGFAIERETYESAKKMSAMILYVSKERWVAELDSLLVSPDVHGGLRSLMDMGLLRFMIPELVVQRGQKSDAHVDTHDMWEHTVAITSLTPCDAVVRWAALLHDIAKHFVRTEQNGQITYGAYEMLGSEMVLRLGKYLRWSNKRIEEVSELVRYQSDDANPIRDAHLRMPGKIEE